MPKNTLGGNKAKKQGRKYTGDSNQKHTRLAKEDGEMYAVVTKMEGGSNCEVKCCDSVSRLCIIRKKFKGKGKRDNSLSIGIWVLVGLRGWETTTSGREKCDLLEVYSSADKNKIKNCEKNINLSIITLTNNDSGSDIDDNIEFTHSSIETPDFTNIISFNSDSDGSLDISDI